MHRCLLTLLFLLPIAADEVRPVPPPGVEPSAVERTELEAGLKKLQASLGRLRSPGNAALLPDVEIFEKAVRFALRNGEFFKPEDVGRAQELLRTGQQRADDLAQGKAPWTQATGLVVRGYRSKIDQSIQPYGLVIPETFRADSNQRWRLDTWFHGRSETLSEVNFLADRMTKPGEFTPPSAIVLHLYGRYCNANKFAGEVDLFEALDAVKQHYKIDANRIVLRGFSMGGAAVWHLAAHYAGEWAAAAPGAGFSETADFLKVFQNETLQPTEWEQKLWRLYDATDYAANFFNLPVVAYSGEIDRQKQAADIMAKAMEAEGLTLTHIIGPQTAHKYHPDAKVEISRRIDQFAEKGRDPYPHKLRFTTFTLKYNRMKWLRIDGLGRHWTRARADAEILPEGIQIKTGNVTGLTLEFEPGALPLKSGKVMVSIDGIAMNVAGPKPNAVWTAHFHQANGKWAPGDAKSKGIRKIHNLQGPIDDAFMDSFIIVEPTGAPKYPETASWTKAEMQRAILDWRRQYRGEAIVKKDTEVTAADIAHSNLVLFGDPGSNRVIARIEDKLPLRFPGGSSTLAMIYPNPLNPSRYVVLNSGATQRAYDYLNNARQIPRLPDYAVIDASLPPGDRYPGKILDAGFFNEQWEREAGTTQSPGQSSAHETGHSR